MKALFQQTWSASKLYRLFLILAVLYGGMRLLAQVALLSGVLLPGQSGGVSVPNDLNDYLTGASHLQQRLPLYPAGQLPRIEFYQYSPAYALVFQIFLNWPPAALVTFHTLLHLAAYGLLYLWWWRIFDRLQLAAAQRMLVITLPLWLVFVGFWSDLGYLNIYLLMALLATLLIEAVVFERGVWALLWLSLILQTKPQWAFALAVPLCLGRFRFFFRLLLGAAVIYGAVAALTILTVGPAYGWSQYGGYYRLLSNMSANFPWRGPASGFLGYNHSIAQTVLYLLGPTPDRLPLIPWIKLAVLMPLAAVVVRAVRHPGRQPGYEVPVVALDWAFVMYLAAFIWLDVVWEVSLGIALFTYLLATLEARWLRWGVWLAFLPYALADIFQFVGFVVLGEAALVPGGLYFIAGEAVSLPSGLYILTDPSIYLPVIMIVILFFYAILIGRLWRPRLA